MTSKTRQRRFRHTSDRTTACRGSLSGISRESSIPAAVRTGPPFSAESFRPNCRTARTASLLERSHSFRLVYPSLTLDQAASPAPSVSGFVVVSAVGGLLHLAALATLYAIALRPGASKERPEA